MGDKEVKYRTPNDGLKTELFEDVESVDCVGQNDSEYLALIIGHSSGPNTVVEPVTDLYSVNDA